MTIADSEYQPNPDAIAKPFVHDTSVNSKANTSPPTNTDSVKITLISTPRLLSMTSFKVMPEPLRPIPTSKIKIISMTVIEFSGGI
ncbi:hypothetical protein PKHYL_30770 [Psychrobacter sp. KH172YL61]|nr:hypothetical protein PKHYL_30770 [Psychrobacter sp. KH172YL61]